MTITPENKYFTHNSSVIHNKNNICKIKQNNTLYPVNIARFFEKIPNIWVMGNTNLLNNKNTVGFCGSRKASSLGIKSEHNCIQELVKKDNNVVIVSGNANGIDLAAHHAALKNGANTILVLPEGLNNFKIKPILRSVWDWDRVLVISMFTSNTTWRAWQAMKRNTLILSLSKAMVVVEASETGGSMAAANSAIEHGVPLFVIDYYRNPIGNNNLLQSDKVSAIRKSNHNGIANIDNLWETVFK